MMVPYTDVVLIFVQWIFGVTVWGLTFAMSEYDVCSLGRHRVIYFLSLMSFVFTISNTIVMGALCLYDAAKTLAESGGFLIYQLTGLFIYGSPGILILTKGNTYKYADSLGAVAVTTACAHLIHACFSQRKKMVK